MDAMVPAAVRMTTSDTTLSETIFSIVPANRFRMLVLMPDSFLKLINSGSDNGGDGCDDRCDARYTRSMRCLCNGTNSTANNCNTVACSTRMDNNCRLLDRRKNHPEIQN